MGKYVIHTENPEDVLCAIMIPNTYNWLRQIIVPIATNFLLHCKEMLMELQKHGQNVDLIFMWVTMMLANYNQFKYKTVWKSDQMAWK